MSVIRALSQDKKIRVFYADITDAVDKISAVHSLDDINKMLFAEMAVSSILLSSDIKDEQSVFSAVLKGNSPLNNTVVVCDGQNRLKGYTSAELSGKYDFSYDIKGKAVLTVINDVGLKNPYITQIPLEQRSMSACIEAYLKDSQQHAGFATENCQNTARGILIQPVLNFEYVYCEQRKDELLSMSNEILVQHTIQDIRNILSSHGFNVTSEYEINAECDCNTEKIEKVIISLGSNEAMNVINEMGFIEITCPYCLKKYRFDIDDIKKIFDI